VPAAALTGIVTALATTPIKGLRLLARDELMVTEVGVTDNRCFFLIDERAVMVNGKRIGTLSAVVAHYDSADGRLELQFPDGTSVEDDVRHGEELETQFFSQTLRARLLLGPFAQALSEFAGQKLRLVRADPRLSAIDRGPRGAVSLISEASVQHLSGLAGEAVDPRRFRMLIEVTGPAAHEEDSLVGARARIGDALVAIHGHVGRCLITTQQPETGEVNLPTLDLLASYRRGLETTEPLAFGVYGEVLEPGRVKIGDALIGEAALP
jgi:uncharacterized protein